MFPGAFSSVAYNEAGEPTGWDNSAYFEPEYDDTGMYGDSDMYDNDDEWDEED